MVQEKFTVKQIHHILIECKLPISLRLNTEIIFYFVNSLGITIVVLVEKEFDCL